MTFWHRITRKNSKVYYYHPSVDIFLPVKRSRVRDANLIWVNCWSLRGGPKVCYFVFFKGIFNLSWKKKLATRKASELALLCLTPLSTIQLYCGRQFCGGNRSTKRKPPTCCKSLINISCDSHWLHRVVVNPTTIRSWPWHPLKSLCLTTRGYNEPLTLAELL